MRIEGVESAESQSALPASSIAPPRRAQFAALIQAVNNVYNACTVVEKVAYHFGSRKWISTEQPAKLSFGRAVGAVGLFLQAVAVENRNYAAPCFDESKAFECFHRQSHAWASNTEHQREKLMRQFQ